MTCPHLKEVTLVFCAACPVRKPVPIDRLANASRCAADGFTSCPIFREALERMGGSLPEETPAAEPPAHE
jgi:hypothetical protein